MNDTLPARPADPDVALAWFAKLVVAFTFVVIFVGGHTTTAGAGMAFPDWPLSHGSVNPHGWWEDLMQRLEHGHRMLAETTGLLVGILCAWVWRSKWSLPVAIATSLLLAVGAHLAGASRPIVAHVGLWTAAGVFAAGILLSGRGRPHLRSPAVRWLAFAGFLGICAQAVLGGLRVVLETGGGIPAATAFRVLHGCFAQLELCLLVALAAMLSPAWRRVQPVPEWKGVSRLGWLTAGAIFLQLVLGATMRHLGAGLAIPSFPQAAPGGSWLPAVHNGFVHLNFAHTRAGAIIVTILVLLLAFTTLRIAGGSSLLRGPAALLMVLVCSQFLLGMMVIWQMRPPFLTTSHVVNGAALLATTVLLAVRAGRSGESQRVDRSASREMLQEVHA